MTRPGIGTICAIAHAFLVAAIAILINRNAAVTNSIVTILFQNVVCMFVVILMKPRVVTKVLRTTRYSLHLSRALFGLGIYLFHYQSLKVISPVAAVSLLHTAPIFIPFIEWAIAKKKPSVTTFSTIFLGFIGVLFILDPRLTDFTKVFGVVLGLSAGLCFAATFPITRVLRSSESVLEIIFLYSFHSLIISSALVFYSGSWHLDPPLLRFYLEIGVLNFLQIYLINIAISFIGSVKSGIMTNLSVIFVILINLFINKSTPELVTFFGVSIVLLSALLIIKDSSIHSKKGR